VNYLTENVTCSYFSDQALTGLSRVCCMQVAVDMDFDKEMVRLHQKVRAESLVGW